MSREGGEEIRDDRRAGASVLARQAVEILARFASGARALREVREEQARLANLRPSMMAIEGALERFVTTLASVDDLPWDRAVEVTRRACLDRLDESRARVVENAAGILDASGARRVVTVSCSSTVVAVLESRAPLPLLVSEGRPGFEGRTVARTFQERGFEVYLCADAALPGLLDPGDLVLVGADAVESDGHLINKIGTRPVASVASLTGIPAWVVCESFKISSRSGLVLEEMEPQEVWSDAPPGIRVRNPYFERTPGHLFDGFITDEGVLGWSEGRWVRSD